VNKALPFPLAERLGIALMGLIQAIAAQCDWWLPRWVISMMEDEVRRLVEAITPIAADVAQRKAAAAAEAESGAAKPRRVRPTKITRQASQ
jgi:hypothetical protein